MMRALTVHQPWAYAIAALGKDVENRKTRWRHRGLLAIHAGLLVDPTGFRRIQTITGVDTLPTLQQGAVVAVTELYDVHPWGLDCCTSDWREIGDAIVHLMLRNTVRIRPVPCRGTQGLWLLPAAVEAAVREQIPDRVTTEEGTPDD